MKKWGDDGFVRSFRWRWKNHRCLACIAIWFLHCLRKNRESDSSDLLQPRLPAMSSDDQFSQRTSSAASGDSESSKSPKGAAAKSSAFDFWQKRRSVAPATTIVAEEDNNEHASEPLLFLNNPTEFDFRSLFRWSSSVGVNDGGAMSPVQKEKRRLRSREELCLMATKTHNRAKISWFLSPGYIGRESGEHILVSTKDPTMDPIHAEILIDGDDYLIRDHNSSSGTFLCLTTINRHHPQRDGFRLRNGDSFLLGLSAKVVVHEVCSEPILEKRNEALEQKLQPEQRLTDVAVDENQSYDTGTPTVGESRRVRFKKVVHALDGSPIVGNRYKRKKKKALNSYTERHPLSLSLSIVVEDKHINKELQLPGKDVYLIGSSPVCDIQIPADGVHPVHARIVFDGFFFVLQDLSFEENPKRKTRVALHQPTRIGRGDCLMFGACVLHVVNAYRAFRDHEPDMKEVALKCHLLRPSKRKSRSKEKYVPFGFRHHVQDVFVFGKGRHCDGHIFTASLSVEQFAIQLAHGACSLVPRAAGINQGVYFLLGRDCMPHETSHSPDLVRYTSKALMLVEGSVFKCGNTEVEVVYVKNESQSDVAARTDEVRENTHFLGNMPWIQQISFDRQGLENVAKRGQRLQLQPGDTIYDEGDPATFLFIVISGEVELVSQRDDAPQCWRLSIVEGYLSSFDATAATLETMTEQVATGSFFGEVCLCGVGLEYSENAKATSSCVLLAISRDDICSYFSHYMDIIQPHLAYESHRELLQKLRLYVPWLRGISYQALRILASKAERASYEQGDSLVEDGLFSINSTQRSGGLLLLGYGKAQLMGKDDPSEQTPDENDKYHEMWKLNQPIACSAAFPLEESFYNVKARSQVECYFFDVAHVGHLIKNQQEMHGAPREGNFGMAEVPQFRRASTNRKSSFATLQQRARHSQVVMSSINGTEDDEHNLENADVEDLNDPAQKWRRKKRNKNLLEKTIIETQQNTDLVNALVMYVLSGANRGEIHVVRNVASVGGILSNADMELNDRYVSQRQAVIQHRDGRFWLYDNSSEWGTYVRLEENQTIQVHPGDVFNAGEVEFTCLAAFPVRKKTQICSIQ